MRKRQRNKILDKYGAWSFSLKSKPWHKSRRRNIPLGIIKKVKLPPDMPRFIGIIWKGNKETYKKII